MKVSVLVPVYNGEPYLAECLESILAQDFGDFELLIGDNASTDGTPDIIGRYAKQDSRISCWRNATNVGLVGNFRICLQKARGNYIKFMCADDKLLSRAAVRKQSTALDENPTAVLAGSRQHLTGTNSTPLNYFRKSGVYNGKQVIVSSLEQNTNLIGSPAHTMFRRGAAGRGIDERFVGMLDFELWCNLLEQGDFVYQDEVLATWRVHEAQQTAQNRKTHADSQEQLLFMEAYYAKPWLQQMATDRMLFAQIYYLRKNYGAEAQALTSAMLKQLSPRRYRWELLKHKVSRPFQKLARKVQKNSRAGHAAIV